MRLNRVSYDPDKAGQPVTMVIGTTTMSVRDYQDNPNPTLLMDPFTNFSSGYSGAPTPKAIPERDVGIFGKKPWGYDKRGTYINIGAKSAEDYLKKRDENTSNEDEES
jgi:hypothetical protein